MIWMNVRFKQIGRFLDLDILSQGCEDVLVDHLCLDNLPAMLRWSELPHGSPWVRRQALQLLREEFSSIAQSSVLLELDKAHLIEALQSDFLQVIPFIVCWFSVYKKKRGVSVSANCRSLHTFFRVSIFKRTVYNSILSIWKQK